MGRQQGMPASMCILGPRVCRLLQADYIIIPASLAGQSFDSLLGPPSATFSPTRDWVQTLNGGLGACGVKPLHRWFRV